MTPRLWQKVKTNWRALVKVKGKSEKVGLKIQKSKKNKSV